MVKLSNTDKMPCKSWSLEAVTTCPGSKEKDGSFVPACDGCYARGGFYNMPNVKKPRDFNKEDWKREEWVDEMVKSIYSQLWFRWLDSGDLYDRRLAYKVYQVMSATPWIKHWLPTRMYKFDKFKSILMKMNRLPNVVVRYSSDSISGGVIRGKYSSTIIPTADTPTKGAVCGAYSREGKCGDCRDCWDKSIKVIAYPAHGPKMKKILAMNI